MKRVLVWTDRAGLYGAEQWTHRTSLALAAAGRRVTIAQPLAEHGLVAERHAHGIVHRWLDADDLYERGTAARMLVDRDEPARVIAESAPDAILFADSSPFASLAAKEVAAARGVPFVAVVHCVTDAWANELSRYLERLAAVWALAAEVVTVSAENLARLRARFGLPAGKGVVVPNGRPQHFFAPRDFAARVRIRAGLGIADDAILVLTIGRFERVKGYLHLAAALERLRARSRDANLVFVWVGDGTLEPRLRATVRLLRAEDRVRILAPRADVVELYDAADIFVLPSHFEGMPLVVLEAMAKALPVIATAVSGTPEALGDTGRLLPDPASGPPTAEPLATAIAALAADPAARSALGRAAQERASALFREETMVARHLAHVARALGEDA